MTRIRTASLAVVAAGVVGLGFASWGASAATSATAPTLSSSESAGLTFSREEERMAHDLYTLFADKYDTAPFATIAASEQRHFDAVGTLLDRYDLADPSAGAKAGVYADQTVQKLYDEWKAEGSASATAAYTVGVELEKRDVADLQRLQHETTNADLDRLYGHLETASEHHLAAFSAASTGDPLPMGNGQGMRGDRSGTGMRGAGGHGNGAGNGNGNGAGRHQNQDCPNR